MNRGTRSNLIIVFGAPVCFFELELHQKEFWMPHQVGKTDFATLNIRKRIKYARSNFHGVKRHIKNWYDDRTIALWLSQICFSRGYIDLNDQDKKQFQRSKSQT